MTEHGSIPQHLLDLKSAAESRAKATETAARMEQARDAERDAATAAHDAAAENLELMIEREQEITQRYVDALRAAGYVQTADGVMPAARADDPEPGWDGRTSSYGIGMSE